MTFVQLSSCFWQFQQWCSHPFHFISSANPSLGMTTTKTLRSVFSWCGSNHDVPLESCPETDLRVPVLSKWVPWGSMRHSVLLPYTLLNHIGHSGCCSDLQINEIAFTVASDRMILLNNLTNTWLTTFSNVFLLTCFTFWGGDLSSTRTLTLINIYCRVPPRIGLRGFSGVWALKWRAWFEWSSHNANEASNLRDLIAQDFVIPNQRIWLPRQKNVFPFLYEFAHVQIQSNSLSE